MQKLKNIIDDYSETDLKRAIAKDVLEEYETDEAIIKHLQYISNYGCSGGGVTGLIYYTETLDFYYKHNKDIDDIYNDLKDGGVDIDLKHNISNTLAWLGYETVACELLDNITEN